MNEIIFRLSDEDRSRLDAILAALQNLATQAPENKPQQAEEPLADKHPVEAETLPWGGNSAEEKPAEKKVDRNEVQNLVIGLVADGKSAEAREIVSAYAPKVGEIPEDKLAEAYERLLALK